MGKEEEGLLGRQLSRKKIFLPISGFVVYLLAANQGRGPSFLFSLQAKHSLKLPVSVITVIQEKQCYTPCSWCSELPALSHVGTWQEQEGGKTNRHAHPGQMPECTRKGWL